MDEGLQEDGGPALAGVQGALPHHGAGRKAEGGLPPFSSSEGGSEAELGTYCAGPVNTHSGFSLTASAKQRVLGSVRKGDKPPQSHHLRRHPGRAGSTAWPRAACRQPVPQPGPGIQGAAGWDEVFRGPGVGREPQPEMQSPERPNLDLLGAKETEGNDREELSS